MSHARWVVLLYHKNITLNSTHYLIMNIPNKRDLQQIAFNHQILTSKTLQKLQNLYKKCTAKQYYFLVIDAILASDIALRFRRNLLERILKLIMIIEDKIRNERLQHDIDRQQQKYQDYHQVKIVNLNIL